MVRNTEHTEKLILHAIDIWDQEMKQLFQPDCGKPCPYCPKRFIYGCFCSFERQYVEETISLMVEKGTLGKRVCDSDPKEFYLEKLL